MDGPGHAKTPLLRCRGRTLHFGPAAAALYLTQPALSRQIRQLEADLGVELLERTSRQVTLTPAGKRLAEDGARLLADSEAAVAQDRRAGESEHSLTVGFMPGMDIAPVITEFAHSHPEVDIQLPVVTAWDAAHRRQLGLRVHV